MPWGVNQQINQFHVANAVTGVALCLCLLSLLIEAKKTTSILSIHEQLDHGCLRSGDLGSDSDFLLHDLEPLFVHLLNGYPNLIPPPLPGPPPPPLHSMPIIQMFKWECELK